MNQLIKIIENADGESDDVGYWHLTHPTSLDPAILCTGEYYTKERSINKFHVGTEPALAEVKQVKTGGITCPNCINFIKLIKSVKL